MARLNWREIRAEDGTNDGLETTNGRWVISSITHIASGSVEYFFDRCPMLETEERRDQVTVTELVPAKSYGIELDADGGFVLDDEGAPKVVITERDERDDDGNLLDSTLRIVRDDDGAPVTSEQVWLEVVRDERPPGSTDIDEMKALAQAYEDGPESYAKFEGDRTARRQQRRAAVREQRAAEQRSADIDAIVANPDLLDALADALQGRGG